MPLTGAVAVTEPTGVAPLYQSIPDIVPGDVTVNIEPGHMPDPFNETANGHWVYPVLYIVFTRTINRNRKSCGMARQK